MRTYCSKTRETEDTNFPGIKQIKYLLGWSKSSKTIPSTSPRKLRFFEVLTSKSLRLLTWKNLKGWTLNLKKVDLILASNFETFWGFLTNETFFGVFEVFYGSVSRAGCSHAGKCYVKSGRKHWKIMRNTLSCSGMIDWYKKNAMTRLFGSLKVVWMNVVRDQKCHVNQPEIFRQTKVGEFSACLVSC